MNLSVMLRQSAAKQAGLPMLSQGCSLGFHGNSIFRAWCNPQKILGHLFVIFLGHGTFTDTHLNGYNCSGDFKKIPGDFWRIRNQVT